MVSYVMLFLAKINMAKRDPEYFKPRVTVKFSLYISAANQTIE